MDNINYEKFSSGKQIVFLVGAPRSGTTYLQRLLSSHPNIKTAQESHLFDNHIAIQLQQWDRLANPEISIRTGIGMPCYHTNEEFIKILRSFSIELLAPFLNELNTNDLFLEKTPLHSNYLQEIKRIFPKAKVIHIMRHPLDMARSYIHAGKTWSKNPKTATQAGFVWKNAIQNIENTKHLFEGNYFELKYEELIKDTPNYLKQLFIFLSLNHSHDLINQIVEINTKQNLKNGNGGKIPVKGEIAQRTKLKFIKEPDTFINTKKFRLNIIDILLVWRKVKKIGKYKGYKCSLSSLILNNYNN